MLRLITGPSGVGKTIITLKEISLIKDRPKFATPINCSGFSYKDHLLNELAHFSLWQNVPDESLIFCDDANKFIPFRDNKEPLEQWILDLARHRHRSITSQKSIDIYFTALNPLLIDSYVRSLIEEHTHYYYASSEGLILSRTWPYCVNNPNNEKAFIDAQAKYLKLSDFFSGVD